MIALRRLIGRLSLAFGNLAPAAMPPRHGAGWPLG
jgi:hypothetical protein